MAQLENVQVSVRSMVYNHEKYLRRCLEGFVMQKTNFKFEVIVHDDASTDGSQDIIREFAQKYPEIIKPILETENQYSKHDGSIERIANGACRGKYIALCEGDDFWTDPYKLQKQFDALETHPECNICFSRVQAVEADGVTKLFTIPRKDCVFEPGVVTIGDLIREELGRFRWCFHTSSFLVRSEFLKNLVEFRKASLPSFPYGDMPLQISAMLDGKGYFLEDVTGCYRRFSGGYNSSLKADPELKARLTRKINAGYLELDSLTEFKYHKIIQDWVDKNTYTRILRGRTLKPRYLRFIPLILKQKLSAIFSKIANQN